MVILLQHVADTQHEVHKITSSGTYSGHKSVTNQINCLKTPATANLSWKKYFEVTLLFHFIVCAVEKSNKDRTHPRARDQNKTTGTPFQRWHLCHLLFKAFRNISKSSEGNLLPKILGKMIQEESWARLPESTASQGMVPSQFYVQEVFGHAGAVLPAFWVHARTMQLGNKTLVRAQFIQQCQDTDK